MRCGGKEQIHKDYAGEIIAYYKGNDPEVDKKFHVQERNQTQRFSDEQIELLIRNIPIDENSSESSN